MPRAFRAAVLLLVGWVAAACAGRQASPVTPTPPAPTVVPVMGAPALNAAQLTAWFNARQSRAAGVYSATVPVETLSVYFVEEGALEGVTGDVAFVQSVVETGWFRFSASVPGWMNNFAGIGATDTSPSPAVFPDPRTGVRAQVQHLRAYADPGATACAVPPLHAACVDPRFALVVPKGKAPTWNQMGNGNWATASTYAASILQLYDDALRFNGLPGVVLGVGNR